MARRRVPLHLRYCWRCPACAALNHARPVYRTDGDLPSGGWSLRPPLTVAVWEALPPGGFWGPPVRVRCRVCRRRYLAA